MPDLTIIPLSPDADAAGADHDASADTDDPGTQPILIPVGEAPALVGCSLSTIDRWLRARKLSRYAAGRRVYVDRRELVRLTTPVRRR